MFTGYIPKYFFEEEFLRCSPSCYLTDMDSDFMEKLDNFREYCGFPLVLNCAYRSISFDLSRGRSGQSAHCRGRAVDIRCNNSKTRASLVLKALASGFRVGVAKSFVHIDDLPCESGSILWTYD